MSNVRLITLSELARARQVSTAALRQRAIRGTLKARKVGHLWVVDPAERDRVLAELQPVTAPEDQHADRGQPTA